MRGSEAARCEARRLFRVRSVGAFGPPIERRVDPPKLPWALRSSPGLSRALWSSPELSGALR
eukprot:15346649-Alexandrium_andersonii.AAC.1